jgi:hypothetical protein
VREREREKKRGGGVLFIILHVFIRHIPIQIF